MFESLESRQLLSVAPIISEVNAANKSGILDASAAAADWLEICNPDPTASVDLAGWSLSYQKTGSSKVTTWTLPATDHVVLGPNESRVVFCDSTSVNDAVQELHTNFNLSKDGATLKLLNASGTKVSSLTYPALSSDTSYGIGEVVSKTDLVASGATASYFCPTDSSLGTTWTQPGFDDSTWSSGPTGLGTALDYASLPGFATTLYVANTGVVSSLTQATAVINTPSQQASATSTNSNVLDFLDTGSGGHFTSQDAAFPGMKIGQGSNYYVLKATGTLTITAGQAGYYTFGVNSDEGFSLSITGANFTALTNATNSTGTNTMAYSGLRTSGDTLGTTYLAAGSYPISLIYFENQGSANLEFYAAKESSAAGVTSFDSNSVLVGATTATTASGGTSTTTTPLLVSNQPVVGTSSLNNNIATNVSAAVKAAESASATGTTSLYSRIEFDDSSLSSLTSLTLRMQYGSGYVAYLNGVKIASSNAPASPAWNSAALEYRNSPVQATTYEDVDISSFLNSATTGHLAATGNVLAIQSLMATPTDQDLYVSPAISQISITQAGQQTFREPTPGTYNTPGSWEPNLTYSVQHGMFSSSFPLTLSTTTPGASIYYTTDNSTPGSLVVNSIAYSGTTATVTTAGPIAFVSGDQVRIAGASPTVYNGVFTVTVTGSNTFTYTLPSTPTANASGTGITATVGTLYSGPVTISTTVTVRAVTVVGGQSGVVMTQSYVFPAAVINQPATPAGYPTVWGVNTGGSPQPANYGMNTAITQNPLYSAGLIADLLSLPSVSITTDTPNMWSAAQSATANTGIYSNEDSLAKNSTMEVPASFEYFNSSGSISVQANMGLQIEGGFGRHPEYEKHSFRMQFSSDYGPSSLEYPLFSDSAVSSFKNVDLKAGFNDGYAWAGDGSPPGDAAQYMRDLFGSKTALAMGQTSFHSNYVFLYVNGLFWGMYMMDERPDTDFAASNLGGSASNYEANNSGNSINGETALPYWTKFQNLTSSDTKSLAFYEMTQGNNADGTPNSSYTDLVNMTSYIDYMLVNLYIGNADWPYHNYYAAINTVNPTGFQFFQWDDEMSLGLINGSFSSNLTIDMTGVNSGVASLYGKLKSNPEFAMAFADQVQQYLFHNGALTPTATVARYQSQIDTIEKAMVLESARWGTIPTSAGPLPDTQAAWLNEANWITSTYLPQRTGVFLSQLQSAGLYPTINAPEFSVNGVNEYGGNFNPGDTLTLSCANLPTGAVIYYTLDGSDPRLLGGARNMASDVFQYTGPIALAGNQEVRARVYSGGTWSAISQAEFFLNYSALRVTEVMYDPTPATAAEIAAGYVVSDTTDPWKDFQFIEIQNTGSQTIPLGGLKISSGIDFTFPQYQGNVSTNPQLTLAPNSYIVVVSDLAAFTIRYGAALQAQFGANWQNLVVAGQFSNHHLNDGGDTIVLSSPNGAIEEFTYDSSWYSQTHGGGFSLTVQNPTESSSRWSSAAGWQSSGAPNGSPGTAETTPIPLPGAIAINEVLANPTTAGGDMIELHNTTAQAISVGGWWLSDDSSNRTKYQIAAGTSIAAGAYLVLTDAANYGLGSGDSGAKVPFFLNKDGFSVYLSSNVGGTAGGYRVKEDYGASPQGMTVGQVATSTGDSDFVLLASASFGRPSGGVYPGAANSLAYVSPIVMTELQYDPSQPTAAEKAAGYIDSDSFEYIELYNRSNTTQTLSNYYMDGGVGFTFGWVSDGAAYESQTMEAGAAATWTTAALAAGTYTVYANFSTTDPNGNARKADSAARYTITFPGGSTTITVDQNTAVSGRLSLGAITTTGPGTVQVQLLRQASASPSDWTLAGQVEFVATGVDLTVGGPALTSFSTTSGITTLAPGAYVLLVSNLQAFQFRYGTGLPIAGQYTGQQNNGGESLSLAQFGAAEASGYIPSYTVDRVHYTNAAPWPTEAAGSGPALIRVHLADYGDDPQNWMASGMGSVANVGAAAGAASLTLDPIAPSVPTGLAAQASLSPSKITLTWNAATDAQSSVAYYVVYRNGMQLGTAATTSYADATAVAATNYTYTVSAVNRDGYESSQSATIIAALPGVSSYTWLDNQDVAIYFNEPLTAATATVLSNYSISGGITFSAVALSRDGTAVTLTTSTAVSSSNAYTITMSGLATVSGNPLPASMPLATTYQTPTGQILLQVWQNINSGGTINYLTDPTLDPNYPNSPTSTGYLTSFETLSGTYVNNYGERIRGYIYPPVTGTYVFWIAADDCGQLWLSTDASPSNVGSSPICQVTSATNYRQWNKYSSQQSASINLVAGHRYYIEALMKQSSGGDNLSVAWQIPGTTFNTSSGLPIPGTYLSPLGGNMDLNAPAAPVDLRAAVTGSNSQISLTWNPIQNTTSGVDHYAIYRDGSLYATSTTASYTDTSGISSLTRHSYKVAAVNYDGIQGELSLPVSISPVGITSTSVPSATSVLLAFSEPVDSVSAQQSGNYQLSGGATVASAVLESDGRSVLLTTSALGSATYTLTVSNVQTAARVALPVLTATFSYVSAASLPAPTSVDIGSPAMTGSATYSSGAWTLSGGGADVWTTNDQCQYLFVPAATSSSGTWIVHVASLTGNSGDGGWSKAGIMARASTSTLVADVGLAETTSNKVSFQWTSTTGTAPNNYTTGGSSSPQWLELTYDGAGVFKSYYSNSTSSTPPTSWTQLGSQQTVTMPSGGFDIGVFITGHSTSYTSKAVFDYNNFMSPPPVATDADIGSPGVAGSSRYSSGTWTVTGSGADVWNTTDQSHYVYVPVTTASPATWIVHVASLTGNSGDGGWSKAGIMARASTSTLVADVLACETSSNQVAYQWTSATGTAPNNSTTGGSSAPQWIKMTYDGAGNFKTYYSSSTGSTPPTSWTQLGSQQTVTMPSGGFDVGIVVCAHNNSSTSTAVIDYNNFLSPSASTSGYVAPTFAVTANSLLTSNTSPAITGTCSDPMASVSVRVNGNWYAVANNNGSWTLPAGYVPALADGAYTVTVCGVNAAGQAAFATAAGVVVVDGAPPIVSLPSVGTQTSPVSSLALAFSKPIAGFSLQNIQLTLNGIGLPLGRATLTTTDNQHWTLGNLADVTCTPGTYSLSVTPAGWGTTDTAGNVFSTPAAVSWNLAQVLTSLAIQSPVGLGSDGTESLSATALDQFGNAMASQPSIVWSVIGAGSISSTTGVFTPPYTAGTTTVRATSGSLVGSRVLTLPGAANWTGGTNASWSAAGSWTSATLSTTAPKPGLRGAAGDEVVFTSTSGGTVSLDGTSPALAVVTFNTAVACTIAKGTGGTLHLANGSSPVTVVIDTGSHVISAPVALDSNVTLLPAAGSQLTISGDMSGTGQLVVGGSGKVILRGANSSSGGVTVSAGTLVVASADALKDGCSLSIGASAATLFHSNIATAAIEDLTASVAAVSIAATEPMSQSAVVAAKDDKTLLPATTLATTAAVPASVPITAATVRGGSAASTDGHGPAAVRDSAATAVSIAKVRSAAIATQFARSWVGLDRQRTGWGSDGADEKRLSLRAFDVVLAQYGRG